MATPSKPVKLAPKAKAAKPLPSAGPGFITQYRIPVVVSLVVAGLLYWMFSGTPYDETLRRMAEAANNKDVEAFMATVDEDFHGVTGDSKAGFAAFLREGFKRAEAVNMSIASFKVDKSSGSSAHGLMDFRVTGKYEGRTTYFVGTPLRTEQVEVSFVKREGRWLISGLEFPPNSDTARDLKGILNLLRLKIPGMQPAPKPATE